MTTSTLFQYALIWNPTDKEAKEGKKSLLIKEPTTLLAKDQDQASILVAREIPKEYLEQLDQVQIALRPF